MFRSVVELCIVAVLVPLTILLKKYLFIYLEYLQNSITISIFCVQDECHVTIKKKSCRYYAGAMNIFCWHVVNCGCDSRSRHSESFIKSRRVDLSSVVTAPVDWITMRVPPPVVKTVFIHWSWWADEMTDFMVLCVCMTTWKNRNILDIFFRASPNIGGHTGYVVDHDL